MAKRGKYHWGFTLIELLFVIAILGVLTSLGVSYVQKKTENFKIEKTAEQIGILQQAIIAYYTDKNEWPIWADKNLQDTNMLYINDICKNNHDASLCSYLPALAAFSDNPWGGGTGSYKGYFWRSLPNNDATANLMQIWTVVNNENIAKRIAALLPTAIYGQDASIDPNGWYVMLEFNSPPQTDFYHIIKEGVAPLTYYATPNESYYIGNINVPVLCALDDYKIFVFPGSYITRLHTAHWKWGWDVGDARFGINVSLGETKLQLNRYVTRVTVHFPQPESNLLKKTIPFPLVPGTTIYYIAMCK